MKHALAAIVLCASSIPALAAESLNVPQPGGSKVAPQLAVGDRGMAIMSAAVKGSDGTVYRGEGVVTTTTSRFSAGTYEVGFGRDITACAYSATVGEAGIGSAVPSLIAITRRSGNPNGVFLQIRNATSNANEDRDFFVLVFCGR